MTLSSSPRQTNYYDLSQENIKDKDFVSKILKSLKSWEILRLDFWNWNGFEIKSTKDVKENIISITYFWESLNYDILNLLFKTFSHYLPNQETWRYANWLSNFDNKIPWSVHLQTNWLTIFSINFLLAVFQKFWQENSKNN